jgi:hypothetical protein
VFGGITALRWLGSGPVFVGCQRPNEQLASQSKSMLTVAALIFANGGGAATSHVRFTPNSDRESGHHRNDLMSFQSPIISFDRAPCR